MSRALAVVSVERAGNVTYLQWHAPAPLRAAGPVPARLSTRPVRTLARRLAASPAAADLRVHGWLIGLLLAAALCALLGGPA